MQQNKRELLEKICLVVVEWGIYLALFTPLILIKDYFFPFVVPKTIFFRIIVDLIFIPYVMLAISNPRYRPKLNPLTVSIIVFLAIITISSLVGVNFEKSFWSVFERMTGILTFIHLFIFYIILTSVFKQSKHWERILTVSIVVGIFACFYTWTTKMTATQGGGTLGNTSFFAAYLLFDIFFALILFFGKEGWKKLLYGLALAVLLCGLFISKEPCRGAIGALFIGIVAMVFGYIVFYLLSSGKKKIVFATLSLAVIAVILLLQLSYIRNGIAGIWMSGSVQSRLLVWKMSWQGWQERFWLGWGQENFNIPFTKYFSSELPLTRDLWYDRVHNIVFDTAITSGALGLSSYLAIFFTAIFSLLRLIPKLKDKRNITLCLGMAGLLLVYFIQDLFVFDMVSSYMMFFLSLAFISFILYQREEEVQLESKTRKNILGIAAGGLLIALSVFSIFYFNVQPARASRAAVRGMSYPLGPALEAFQQSSSYSPMTKVEVPEQLSMRMIGFFNQGGQDETLLKVGLQLAENAMKENISSYPLDFRSYLFLGKNYETYARLTGDATKAVLGEEVLIKAIALSPKNQQGYWNLAQIKFLEGKNDEGLALFKQAVDLEPRYAQSRWYLALAYGGVNEYSKALQEVKEAEKMGFDWSTDYTRIKQVIGIYKNLGDLNSIVPLYELIVTKFDANDTTTWANLADAYAVLGEREKAKAAAEKLLQLNPDLKDQIEDFLKQLGY